MHGAWLGDYPSIILGQNNGVNQGVMKIFSTPSQYSLFEGNSSTGGLDLSAYQGTQLNINAYNCTGDCLISSTLNANLSINIPSGQTYKINNNEYLSTKTTDDLIQGTTNKYLNALTTTSPNEINLILASNVLHGSLIDNTIDISKIKLSQISITETLNTIALRDMNGIMWTLGLRALYGGTSSNRITAGSIQTIA